MDRKKEKKEYYLKNRKTILGKQKKWILENPERWSAIQKKWREKNKSYIHNSSQIYWKNNRAKVNKKFREKRAEMKKEIFKLLGNQCANPYCPIPKNKLDLRGLQLDHVKGNGYEERKASSGNYNSYLKKILEKIKAGSKEYQLLCAYCNWIKRHENNELPY